MIKLLVPIILLVASTSRKLQAQDLEHRQEIYQQNGEWSRAIRGFRRDHNFSLSYGRVWSQWDGVLTQSNSEEGEIDQPKSFSFSNSGNLISLNYAFHLPIWEGFGYYLGTKTHVYKAVRQNSEVRGDEFSFGLPGLNAGLVYNFSDHLRTSVGLELGWQRIERLKVPSLTGIKDVSISGESMSWLGQLDYFYELSWAFQLSYESSRFSYAKAENLSLHKSSQIWSVGILKHLI
jgi:hypothetical protein